MTTQVYDAKDKTFLITGGASGLGAEYVKTFLQQGAKNVAILDIAEEVGKAFAERMNAIHGDKAVFIKCDVSKEEDIVKSFNEVVERFKQIDVLINNAGIMVDAPAMWRTACDVNYQGLVSFTLKAIQHMSKAEGGAGGTIINISSTAGLSKFQTLPIYNGAKIAVLHFSQSIAMDPFYQNTGIRVLTICFGPTDTPLLHNLDKRSYNSELGKLLVEKVKKFGLKYQKVEKAVESFVDMFKNGAPGSIWLAVDDKPVKNITPLIDRVFDEIAAVIAEP